MITRDSSNYSNNVEICESQIYGKVVVKTPLLEQDDPFWYWCEKIFGLHVRIDPAEILMKSKRLSELLDMVIPKALMFDASDDGISVVYEYLDYNHIDEFDDRKAYEYGRFIGKMHQKEFDCWGNMYDRKIPNDEFGRYICKVIDDYFDSSCSTHKCLLKGLYNEIKSQLEDLKLKSAGIILLDVDADQYVYDENSNILGIVDYEAVAVGPREIELLMWEFYLKDHFDEFMNGYREYCTYQSENIELYRFIVFLLDSLGSDLDYYKWFNIVDCFKDIRLEISVGLDNKASICKGVVDNKSIMDKSIYEKIVEQLIDMKYTGNITLDYYAIKTSYTELFDYIRILKEQLPQVKRTLLVRGAVINKELMLDFIKRGIDTIKICDCDKDKYNEEYNSLNDVERSYIEYWDSSKVELPNEYSATNRDYMDWEAVPCLVPDDLVLIDIKGNIIPCQEDSNKEYIMGNVLQDNIYEVFDSKKYRKFRNYLRHGKRRKMSICKNCYKNIKEL